MKYLIYHLISPLGHKVDLWTNAGKKNPTYKDLANEEIRIQKIEQAGFKMDVSLHPQNAPQSTTGGQVSFCELHKIDMKERQGKYNKFYSHAKELDGTWVYCTGKGWGVK